jgi:hypothetical protein
MCLLVFMSKGVTASEKSLETAAYHNDDGFGWAIRTPDKLLIGKGMDFAKVHSEFLAARSSYDGEALFHLRITTQGGTNLDNCHPFYVGKDKLSVVAHNGMLPVADDKTGRSDTRIFAETLLPKRGGIAFLNGEHTLPQLEKWAEGSKLVFLTVNPASKWRYVIANAELGHWADGAEEGVWYSNKSYTYPKTTWSSYYGGKYSTGYGYQTGWDISGISTWSKDDGDGEMVVAADEAKSTDEVQLYYELEHHAYEIADSLMRLRPVEELEAEDVDYYDIAFELMERFFKIYEVDGDYGYKTTCSRCGGHTYLDYADVPATHCPHCGCCLFCGSDIGHLADAAECCEWPAGWTLSYDPQIVGTRNNYQGGDTNAKETARSF